MLINNSEINLGLSSNEVSERIASGYVNKINSNTKKIKQIFKENLFTFFNILNLVFALLIIFTGTYSNLLFLLVVFQSQPVDELEIILHAFLWKYINFKTITL